jgi:hypothetical protein
MKVSRTIHIADEMRQSDRTALANAGAILRDAGLLCRPLGDPNNSPAENTILSAMSERRSYYLWMADRYKESER